VAPSEKGHGIALLIGELHSKKRSALEENEGHLALAVFGHLRNVCDGRFSDGVLSVPDH
jgi:hypothetical protein